MKITLAFIIIAFSLLTLNQRTMAASITLYDGASGVTPNQYPDTSSTYFAFDSPNGGTQQASGGVTNLKTTANPLIYAGYSNYNITINQTSSDISPGSLVNSSFPLLDRNTGYTLSFTVRINSETDTANSNHLRAGFSVVLLGNDKQGIEIGFGGYNNTTIFSQNGSSFQIGESYNSASTLLTNLTQYDLAISGSTYTLTSGNTTILSGALRDYTAATGFIGSDAYRTPNFIFIGDDTTAASADIDLEHVALTTNSASVPYEFSPSLGILALAACSGVTHLLKKKNS